MSKHLRGMLLLVLLLAACQPATTISPAGITPVLLEVQITPALRAILPRLQDCAYRQGSLGLTVSERPAAALEPARGLILRWGTPATVEGFAAQIGSEELVIIIHPENPLPAITREQLAAVYALQTRAWDVLGTPAPQPGEEIHPWAYNPGDDIQSIFETAIGPIRADAAALAPDPDAMRQAVASDPAAIGFLPRRALDSSVKPLNLSGIEASALNLPLLALAPQELSGLPREWLACLAQDQ